MHLYAVVGLGNPGKEYNNTRHNVGFETIDILANNHDIKVKKLKFKALCGEGRIGNEKVLLVKPQTYMNNSGMSVLGIYKYYKIPVENIIVIVDDVDIDFGTIRIKRKGSAGTHNGLKSIIYQLQREDFPRIKIGIGKPREKQDLVSFVLGKFLEKERLGINKAIEKAASAVETIIIENINKAMNQFNVKSNKAQD